MGLLLISVFLFLSGCPIFVALALGSAFIILLVFNMSPMTIAQLMLGRISSYTLLAMPLFMLAGNLLLQGGGVLRLINFFDAWIGHFRGGLLMASVAFCIFFAAMTGSGYATIAAVGTIMVPEMKKAGYSESLRSGIIACSGQLGNLIPPSISMVIIGALTERSVATLFMAGMVPGLMIGIGLIIVGSVIAARQGVELKPHASWKHRFGTLYKAVPTILMPLVVLGGIYTGQFTPTEAAAVSCLYAILIGLFIYGGLRSWEKVRAGFGAAVRSAVMVYVIMSGVALFGFVISTSGIAVDMIELLIDLGLGKLGLVLILNIFMLGLGFFISPFTLMYLAIPVLAPICGELGINLIWLGVLWLMNALVGAITPPMATGLYIAARIADVEPTKVFRGTIPFLGVWVAVLFLTIFFEDISLFLPRLMGLAGV